MAPEHRVLVDIARVAGVAGHVGRIETEVVVVVGDRHDPVSTAPSDLAVPKALECADRALHHELDCVSSGSGISQIENAEVALDLFFRKLHSHVELLSEWVGEGIAPWPRTSERLVSCKKWQA